ncbi:hypothetical protein E2C01_091413 [Portunus trituberculatus]|uniref:Uncharacterized protein n=1 Tax=Portunus trituberculatus TaxID=210409 RepID=A0A5B7JDW3_PORTR|nr:hypothetical protein [Portunus trituberculatus]
MPRVSHVGTTNSVGRVNTRQIRDSASSFGQASRATQEKKKTLRCK